MPRRRKEDGERVELFPLRRRSSVRGSRSLAREKVLQVLAAAVAAELPWEAVFEHIFYRQFTDVPPMPPRQVLSVEEIAELEADTPIQWDAEEIAFARALLQAAQQYWELAQELLAGVLLNWDLKRLVFLDRILLQLSIAEMLAMPETPVAVIIDEVVELAKRYSTERSGQFINGVLEAVYSLMVQQGIAPALAGDAPRFRSGEACSCWNSPPTTARLWLPCLRRENQHLWLQANLEPLPHRASNLLRQLQNLPPGRPAVVD
jgi:transcription antitermination factor NusB